MRQITVEVKEVWSVAVMIEASDNATKDEMLEAAAKKFEEGEHGESEYSHTLGRDVWTVREAESGEYL